MADRAAVGLVALIRSAIAERHARIESTPLAAALAAGRVDRPRYCALLTRLVPLHRALEQRIAGASTPFESIDWWRSEDLVGDLAALAGHAVPRAGARVDGRSAGPAGDPEACGAAYVVVGSRHGSRVLRPALARALDVDEAPGRGLDYHRDPPDFAARWRAALAALDALPVDAATARRIADGAAATMDAFGRVYGEADDAGAAA